MTESYEVCPTNSPRVIVAIPAYNEGQFIAKVVSKARELADKVIVVNDGSTDHTAQAAEEAGASVIYHGMNKGYGESIRSCFEKIELNENDILVTLDGDAQHDPSDIPKLLAPILRGEADLVIASRLLDGKNNIPPYRKFGIKVITFLYNFGSYSKISDAQSGFRAYNKKLVDALTITERGMGVSVEVIIKARKMGFRIKEVPTRCIYHVASHTSNPVIHGLGVALTVLKFRFGSLFHLLVE